MNLLGWITFSGSYVREITSVEKMLLIIKHALPFNSDDYLGLQEKYFLDSGLSVICGITR